MRDRAEGGREEEEEAGSRGGRAEDAAAEGRLSRSRGLKEEMAVDTVATVTVSGGGKGVVGSGVVADERETGRRRGTLTAGCRSASLR